MIDTLREPTTTDLKARASLKDTDWRFLVPNPGGDVYDHLVLLGGSRAMRDRILEAGLARAVSVEVMVERQADALVVFGQSPACIARALPCLRPGGALYWQVDRRSKGSRTLTPRGAGQLLYEHGLQAIRSYCVWPGPVDRDAYIPLDVEAAFTWYFRAIFVPSSPLRLVLQTVFAAAPAGLLSRIAPCFAMTAIKGTPSPARPSVLGNDAMPAALQGQDLRPLVLTGGDELNRVVLFPFVAHAVQPLAVVKLGRVPEMSPAIDREQRVLSALHEAGMASTADSVPVSGGTVTWGPLLAGIESCAPGRSLASTLRRWRVSLPAQVDDLRAVTAWLTEFNAEAQISPSEHSAGGMTSWADEAIARYRRTFGTNREEDALFDAVLQRAESLVDLSLPLVWVHWGFDERNVFRSDGQISVIDWEGGNPGPPLFDLLYFVTHWSVRAYGRHGPGAELEGFRRLFCAAHGRDRVSAAAYSAISRYMETLRIDPRAFPVLLVLMWLERACGREERQAAVNPAETHPRRDNRYVQYVEALAQHADRVMQLP